MYSTCSKRAPKYHCLEHSQLQNKFHFVKSFLKQLQKKGHVVQLSQRNANSKLTKDDINKRDDKTTGKAEDAGRVGQQVKKSRESADKLRTNNKKRQKLRIHCTNEISHADDDELSFMVSSHKNDNRSF